jgi:hypothetical protein
VLNAIIDGCANSFQSYHTSLETRRSEPASDAETLTIKVKNWLRSWVYHRWYPINQVVEARREFRATATQKVTRLIVTDFETRKSHHWESEELLLYFENTSNLRIPKRTLIWPVTKRHMQHGTSHGYCYYCSADDDIMPQTKELTSRRQLCSNSYLSNQQIDKPRIQKVLKQISRCWI